jgi:hypothetical protein
LTPARAGAMGKGGCAAGSMGSMAAARWIRAMQKEPGAGRERVRVDCGGA